MERRPVPRWLLAALALAAVVVLTGGGWVYRAQEQSLRRDVEAELRAIATLKVNEIARWRAERLGNAAVLMDSPLFVEAAARWLESPQPADQAADQAAILTRFQALQDYYGYDDILLVDAQGQIRLSLSGEAGPLHAEARQALEQALAERRPLLTDLHVAHEGGAPHLGAVAPLFLQNGADAPIGAAFLQLNAVSYLYPLVQAWPTASRTAETLLVRREGDDVLFLNDLRHQPGAALTLRIPLTQTDAPAVMAVLGQEGLVEGRDYRGVPVVTVILRVPDSPWYMVAKEDAAEIYAQWRLYAGVFLGLLGALLAGVIAAGYALWQRQETAHYHALVEAEAALYANEVRYRRLFEAAKDGILILDGDSGQVVDANPYLGELLGYPREALLGKQLWEIGLLSDAAASQRAFLELQDTGYIRYDDLPLETADGRAIQVEFVSNAYRVNGALVIQCNIRDITARKEAEETLRQSEALLRIAGEMAHLGGWRVDLAADRLIWSDEVAAIHAMPAGYSPSVEEAIAFYAPEFRQRISEVYAACAQEGRPYDEELQILNARGERVWVRTIGVAARDDSGRIASVQGGFQDITVQKQAEEALAESEERYRHIFENVSIGLYRTSPDGRILMANPALVRMLGYASFAELAQRNLEETGYEPRYPRERFKQQIEAEGQVIGLESAWVRADGATLYVRESARLMRDEQGRALYYEGTIEDVSARAEAEQALARERALLRTVMDNLPDAVYAADAEGRQMLANRADLALTGDGEEADVLGKTALELFPPEVAETFYAQDLAVLRGGLPVFDQEGSLATPSGEQRWLLTSKLPLRDAQGRIIGLVGISRDITERKAMEEALRERERTWAALISNLPGFVYRYSDGPDWVMTYVSDGCQQVTGYATEEFTGEKRILYYDLVDPTRRDALWKEWSDLLETGGAFEAEYLITHKSGETRWVWERGRGILAEDGRMLYLDGFITDITDRKEAQEALARERILLRTVVDNLPDGVFVTDVAGHQVLGNRASLRQFGFSEEAEVLGKTAQDIFPGERGAANHAQDLAVIESGAPVLDAEGMVTDARGEQRWLLTSKIPLRGAEGRITGLVGVGRDITARKEAEEALRQSEERWRSYVENAPLGVFIADERGRYVEANPEACCMTGYALAELLTLSIAEVTPPEALQEAMASFASLARTGRVYIESPFVTKAGEVRWWAVDAVTLSEGRYLAFTDDITARKEAEQEREQLEGQLRQAQKMQAVGRLAGGVAHDFNNMLQTILGYAEIALEETPPDEALHGYLLEIRNAGQRSANLTRQLLAFARRQTIRPEALDINDTVTSMLRMLGRLIGEDIELIWKPGPNLGQVMMDPSQLDQILANLVVNARDAIGGVGQITIETENVSVDPTYVDRHPEVIPGRYVQLSVSDNGCGMDAETLSHLFEPFFTTKPIGQGTGLGLPTVYGIVRQNEGFINVYSEPGVGTIFRIYLPRHEAEPQPLEAALDALVVGGHATVLLVEDEIPLLQLARRVLAHLGYNVLAASSPERALAMALEHEGEIHLLVTDVVMPEMHGRELAERLQRLRPELKCLYMSGYTANVIGPRGVVEEGVVFLQKPFTIAALAAQVRAAIEGQ
jgi:PAS domain S-box-containing protein